jgi:hypothetical protein
MECKYIEGVSTQQCKAINVGTIKKRHYNSGRAFGVPGWVTAKCRQIRSAEYPVSYTVYVLHPPISSPLAPYILFCNIFSLTLKAYSSFKPEVIFHLLVSYGGELLSPTIPSK